MVIKNQHLTEHLPLKGAETLADVLQRKFAKFGSEEGTRTNKAAKSALKGIDDFYRKLGALV